MPDRAEIERIATELSKRLADEGKLIEAGWAGYRMLALSPDAPQIQIDSPGLFSSRGRFLVKNL
jgi:hypothetical protein